MIDVDELIEKFHEENDVEYELVAKVGDEIIVRHTSSISADDVSGYSYLTDEAMEKYILDYYQDQAEYKVEAEAEAQMEEARLDNR